MEISMYQPFYNGNSRKLMTAMIICNMSYLVLAVNDEMINTLPKKIKYPLQNVHSDVHIEIHGSISKQMSKFFLSLQRHSTY